MASYKVRTLSWNVPLLTSVSSSQSHITFTCWAHDVTMTQQVHFVFLCQSWQNKKTLHKMPMTLALKTADEKQKLIYHYISLMSNVKIYIYVWHKVAPRNTRWKQKLCSHLALFKGDGKQAFAPQLLGSCWWIWLRSLRWVYLFPKPRSPVLMLSSQTRKPTSC